ncbi:unnamed protein product [Cunninghamella blakesleeana]
MSESFFSYIKNYSFFFPFPFSLSNNNSYVWSISPHISRNNSFKNLKQYKDFSSSAPASPLATSYQGPLEEVEDIPTAVVIKNIPFSLKKDGLLYLMISRNIPTPYALNYHYDNGTFRGLAFANYKNPEETVEAMKALNDLEISGRKLRVEFKRQLFSVQQMVSLQKDKNPVVQPRNQQINIDPPMDNRMTELYDQLIEFNNDPNRDTFVPETYSGKERKDVHLIAEQLGLIHQSVGTYPDRGVQVRKKDAQQLYDDLDTIESKSKLLNISDIVIDLPSKRDNRKSTLQNNNNNNNQQEGIYPIRQPSGPDLSKNFDSRKSLQNLSLSEIFIRQHISNIKGFIFYLKGLLSSLKIPSCHFTSSWETYLSPQEAQVYSRLFKLASQTKPGIVTGTEAVQFFANSGVPNGILSEIWETADRDNVGYLTPETFSIALKLIACAQHGNEVSDPIISTVVSLPQFKGIQNEINIVSPNATGNSSVSSASNITQTEREKYQSIFRAHQPVNDTLDASTAKNIFLKSKLSNDVLGQIWALADVRQSGALNQTEFTIAMHYIAKLMDGTLNTLPNQLPPSVYASAAGPSTTPLLSNQSPVIKQFTGNSINNNSHNPTINTPIISQQFTGSNNNRMIMTPPQRAATIDSLGNMAFSSSTENVQRSWDVTAAEKSQYDAFFDRIDIQHQGFIQGKAAVEFFKNSRLADNDLAHIWDLADTTQSGRLSRDEFAVAMHLIHKRLRGETLPPSLPSTLVPPSPRVPIASPSHLHRSATTATTINRNVSQDPFNPPAQASLIDEDLLGDFGNNDQLTQETNQVNQLQNQISSLKTSTVEVKQQKLTAEQTIEQLAKQKQELQAQMTQVRMAHETEVKELNELQEVIKREEPEWMQAKTEFETAQQQLISTQQEIQRLKQLIETSRAESENYRRQVHEIQEETAALVAQVDSLNSQSKQQNMMVDINHRQVKAAEQDREQARRDLQDAKEVKGITDSVRGLGVNEQSNLSTHFTSIDKNNDSSSDEDDSSDDEEINKDHPHKNNSKPTSPSFTNSPFHSFASTSPQTPSSSIENKSSAFDNQFLDIFSPHLAQAETQAQQEQQNSGTNNQTNETNDFDAVFGDLAGIPSPDEKKQNITSSSSSMSVHSSSSPSAKKHRTPPPPPPAATITTTTVATPTKNNFDDIFGDFGSSSPVQPTKSMDDDFDAAFSGPLSDAKILEGDSNKVLAQGTKSDFDDFDEAFGVFDSKNNESSTLTTNKNQSWDDSFGNPSTVTNNHPDKNKSDDWDSIFGGNTTTQSANNLTVKDESSSNLFKTDNAFGFDDAFGSSTPAFSSNLSQGGGSSSTPSNFTNNKDTTSLTSANKNVITEKSITGDDSNIDELVKMGFDRKSARDALERYDQDVSKATNFLLDQAN